MVDFFEYCVNCDEEARMGKVRDPGTGAEMAYCTGCNRVYRADTMEPAESGDKDLFFYPLESGVGG